MGSIVSSIGNIVTLENYSSSDASLMVSKSFGRSFGYPSDYVEMHVYTPDDTLVSSDYAFTGYGIPGTGNTITSYLTFTPDQDLNDFGYGSGMFNVQYNILRNRINASASFSFFISDISTDRTEIRVISNTISNDVLESSSIQFISDISTSPYYKDFLLDFGSNQFYLGVNLALDKNTSPYSLLIKLYNPLPSSVNVNDQFWIVEELSDPYSFSVQLYPDIVTGSSLTIGPPNFDLRLDNRQVKSSPYYNYQELLATDSTTTYQLILSKLNQNNVTLNIDYSNYCNFVHFSSANQRLLNFVYKVQQIENYAAQINTISQSFNTPSVISSINTLQTNINTIISKFDGYDNFLYVNSESSAWPKMTATPPYVLFPSTSSQVQQWLGSDDSANLLYGGMLYSSSYYDSENQDNLVYSIPGYLREDPTNANYELFVEMIGHHFDYIWTYIKAFGDIYKTNNSLCKGISKDLVYYMLNSFGIKLYNTTNNQDLFQYLLGVTNSGSYTYPTTSFQTLITSSIYAASGDTNLKELFKRLYHNVPYLLKTKGTEESLRALSTAFGIPSTIMKFNEFGGLYTQYTTTQYSFDRFSYALNTSGSGYLTIPWSPLNINTETAQQASFANTIEFRFKPQLIQSTQSLMEIGDGVDSPLVGVYLQYSASNNIPYGNIWFNLRGSGSTAQSQQISLPIFYTGSSDGIYWWNVMLRRRNPSFALENDLIDFDSAFIINNDLSDINVGIYGSTGSGDQYYDMFVSQEINSNLGHQASSSIYVSQSFSASMNDSWNTSATFYLGGYSLNPLYNGCYQELRFWNISLYQYAFNYHVLNPSSIQGVDSGSFYNNLAGWFPLGNDLYTYNHSIIGSVNSVQPYQSAIFPSASFLGFPNQNSYCSNEETYYANTPVAGYLSPVTDKIRIEQVQISGSVLSPYIRLEEPLEYPPTKDIHIIEASFSPQNEVNRDIISTLGGTFIIDDYIGDPSFEGNITYPDLDNLRALYFERFTNKYDFKDYIQLIANFDNALFKMFEDFVAARANIQTGITIKPTLLERSKVKRYQPDVCQTNNFTASIGGYSLTNDQSFFTGYGNGSDYFDGELSGSCISIIDDFRCANQNPYIHGNGNVQLNNVFKGSDFDVLLNNVQSNVTSSIRRKVDQDNSKLLVATELQDYYYSYKRHIIPRYIGSKNTSFTYNFYTSQSYSGSVLIWPGDTSYGKTAAIDSNTTKFGWVKTIPSSSLNFSDKTSIILKYLVDPSGSLTELSRHNYNIYEVQNTFRSQTPTVVSLTDIISPSNQTTLDGDQNIFEGGFSYWPIVYSEGAEELHFDYLTSIITSQSVTITTTQEQIFQYNTVKPDGITDLLDADVSQGGYALTYGQNLLTSGEFSLPNITPFTNWIYSTIPILSEVSSVELTSGSGGGYPFTTPVLDQSAQSVYQINNQYLNFNDLVNTNDPLTQYVQLNDGSYAIQVARTSTYNFNVNIPFNMSVEDPSIGSTIVKTVAVLECNSGSNGEGPWQFLAASEFSYVEPPYFILAQYGWNPGRSLMQLDNGDANSYNGGTTDFPLKALCNISQNVSLNAGDYVRVSFFIIFLNHGMDDGTQYAKISFKNRFNSPISQSMGAGSITMTDTVNDATIVTTEGFYTQPSLFAVSPTGSNVLVFTDSASLLYGKVIFNQAQISSSTALLYSPIDYPFTFEVGDVVRLTSYYTTNPTYYRVNQVVPPVTGSNGIVYSDLELVLDKPIQIIGSLSANFVIFRRLPDETSVIINFTKNPGPTSQALLIPYDIDLGVKDNIANVASSISQNISGLNSQ